VTPARLFDVADPGCDRSVERFVLHAKEFCRLLETDAPIPQRDLALQLLTAILGLYGRSLTLPEVDPEPSADEPFFDKNLRQILRAQITEKLGGDGFSSSDGPHEAGATLSDSLVGLYIGVKEGLLTIPEHSDRIPAHVIWRWRFGFETELGKHAVTAIAMLHSVLSPML
jgi:hypothetical protein